MSRNTQPKEKAGDFLPEEQLTEAGLTRIGCRGVIVIGFIFI